MFAYALQHLLADPAVQRHGRLSRRRLLLASAVIFSGCDDDESNIPLPVDLQEVASIVLQPVGALKVGERAALRVEVFDHAGGPLSVQVGEIAFTILQDTDIVRIADGEVQAVSAGEAIVMAAINGKVSTAVAVRVVLRWYTITELGSLVGGYTHAKAINSAGQVVGHATLTDGTERAFLWTPQVPNGHIGTMQDLGVLAGFASSMAVGINDAGQVVGNLTPSSGNSGRAFLWQAGAMRIIEGPDGSTYSGAVAINRSGQVLILSGGPYIWTAGTLTSCAGLANASAWSAADINDAGTAVGSKTIGPGEGIQFGWMYADGVHTSLGSDLPLAINNPGRILSTHQGNTTAPVLSDLNDVDQFVGRDPTGAVLVEDGLTYSLNGMMASGSDVYLESASAINNLGQIIAHDHGNALLLTPQA